MDQNYMSRRGFLGRSLLAGAGLMGLLSSPELKISSRAYADDTTPRSMVIEDSQIIPDRPTYNDGFQGGLARQISKDYTLDDLKKVMFDYESMPKENKNVTDKEWMKLPLQKRQYVLEMIKDSDSTIKERFIDDYDNYKKFVTAYTSLMKGSKTRNVKLFKDGVDMKKIKAEYLSVYPCVNLDNPTEFLGLIYIHEKNKGRLNPDLFNSYSLKGDRKEDLDRNSLKFP